MENQYENSYLDVTEPLHLRFHGPYPLCSETDDLLAHCVHRDKEGIYLWAAEQLAGFYRISYIGETSTSFYRRTKEHLIQTLGDNYRVIDADQMRTGVQQILWDGLWRSGTRTRLPDFLRDYEHLAPAIKRYLLGHSVFIAPIQCGSRVRKRIEGALAQHLRALREASSLLPSDIRFIVRRANEPAIAVSVSAERILDGLPAELQV